MREAIAITNAVLQDPGGSPVKGETRVLPMSVRSGPLLLAAPEAAGLIRQIAETSDRRAFACLFAYYYPRVKAYLLRGGSPSGVAEELAQETMLRVWRRAEKFDPAVATASTWIFVIARNLRIDRLRGERLVETGDPDPSEAPEEPPTGEMMAIATERHERVRSALAALSAEQLRIVELFFFEDLPHSEIAQRLGVPLGTVKSRIRLAVQRLRSHLEDLGS